MENKIVPVHLNRKLKTEGIDRNATQHQIACVIRQNEMEVTLYNDAEMGMVYEVIREVFGYAR